MISVKKGTVMKNHLGGFNFLFDIINLHVSTTP